MKRVPDRLSGKRPPIPGVDFLVPLNEDGSIQWPEPDPTSPFFIHEAPALISFSGGRTSAMMLFLILWAHGGKLPANVYVCFANTGKEREETLRFVHECGSRWSVHVHWLEFVTELVGEGVAGRFNEVGFNSASRNGEPLSRLIADKKALFSTFRGRWCTQKTKVGVMHDFMTCQGYGRGDYLETIGFRADEYDRVHELPRRPLNADRKLSFPLAMAEIRKADVMTFWKRQPFDLALRRGTGNCDHCPFVSDKARIARARLNPEGLDWWLAHEDASAHTFGRMGFRDILQHIDRSPLLSGLSEIEEEAAETDCVGWCE